MTRPKRSAARPPKDRSTETSPYLEGVADFGVTSEAFVQAMVEGQSYAPVIAPTPTIDPTSGRPLTQFALDAIAVTTDAEVQNWSKLLGTPVDRLQAAKLNVVVEGVAVGSSIVGLGLGLAAGLTAGYFLSRPSKR